MVLEGVFFAFEYFSSKRERERGKKKTCTTTRTMMSLCQRPGPFTLVVAEYTKSTMRQDAPKEGRNRVRSASVKATFMITCEAGRYPATTKAKATTRTEVFRTKILAYRINRCHK